MEWMRGMRGNEGGGEHNVMEELNCLGGLARWAAPAGVWQYAGTAWAESW